jgi:hypothetical protein
MGGQGSGSWCRFDKKDAVEDCRSIDVRRWKREGYLDPGNRFLWAWYEDDESVASIGVRTLDKGVELSYTQGPEGSREDVRYTVPLTWTECNFGGRRPWFVCPGVVNGHYYCGRRVARLYMGGATSCAATATTSLTGASKNRIRLEPCTKRRRFGCAWVAPRTRVSRSRRGPRGCIIAPTGD